MRRVGAGGVVPAGTSLVSATATAFARLALIAAAGALGQTLAGLYAPALDFVLAATFGAAAFVLTQDLGRSRPGRGELRYWRGRPVDDRDRRDRWH